jgi:GAF domain-containing protein
MNKDNLSSGAANTGKKLPVGWTKAAKFSVPIPRDEKQRLEALAGYQILDTSSETEFDDLTWLASQICGTPIALISLVDSHRQWFKSKVGIDATETSRDVAFCAHAIMKRHVFTVPDASVDKRFSQNPLVTGSPNIRFYAGAPLVTPDNRALGTLCVIDRIPRELTPDQEAALQALSRVVMTQLEMRKQLSRFRHREQKLKDKLNQLGSAVADLETEVDKR